MAERKIHNLQSSTVIGIGVPGLREDLLGCTLRQVAHSAIRNSHSAITHCVVAIFSNSSKNKCNRMRRFSTFFVALFVLAVAARAEENTAYNALRLIGNLRGEETLKQVLAVSGESGNPQPGMWTIVLDDPAARGGVRELQVVSGQIASERTPVSSELAGGKTIDLNQLNLDSDGAYQVAEEQAKKNGASFNQVSYRLSFDSDTGKPLWVVHLLDSQRGDVGTVKVAADNGTLVGSSNSANSGSGGLVSQGSSPNSDQEVLNQTPESSEPPSIHNRPSTDPDSDD